MNMIYRLLFTGYASFCFCNVAFGHADFEEIIVRVKPQVVTLEVFNKKNTRNETELDEVLGEYADYYRGSLPKFSPKNLGTGFIIKSMASEKRSLIFTAEHVVRSAKRVAVTFSDGKKAKARILWVDAEKDVALLEVESSVEHQGLTFNQGDVAEGQEVLAVSGAFGLPLSSSTGIVAATGVKLKRGQCFGLIQTDTAVNPGSSGGPLFNDRGEVIGLISNIYSNTGNFSGAAFVIPSAVLIKLIEKKGYAD